MLLTRTCCYLPLQYGAVGTFVFSTCISLLPLTSLSHYINRISLQILMMNVCQIAFSSFVGVFAIMGTIQKVPDHLLPFLTFYMGYAIIDLGSIICTIAIGYPFYAHDLLKGGGITRKPVTKTYLHITIIFYTFIFVIRVYFTFLVYSYYKEMKNSIESNGSPENSEEISVPLDTSKEAIKLSRNQV